MVNAIVKALAGRFDENGYATVVMKDAKQTEVHIQKMDGFALDSDYYEVGWGFNNSYGGYADTIEEVAEMLMNFEKVQSEQQASKAQILDLVMELQLKEEGTLEATAEEISELRSEISDWSKDFYHFRYRGHCERRRWS